MCRSCESNDSSFDVVVNRRPPPVICAPKSGSAVKLLWWSIYPAVRQYGVDPRMGCNVPNVFLGWDKGESTNPIILTSLWAPRTPSRASSILSPSA